VPLKLTPQERLAIRWSLMMLPVVITLAAAMLVAVVVQPFFFIISMFFLAWLLAFLLDPIVTEIVRRLPRLPRGLTAALVFFGLTSLTLVGLVAIASSALSSLTNILGDTTSVPQAVDRLIGPLQAQLDSMGVRIDLTAAVNDAFSELQRSGADLLAQIVAGGVTLFTQGTAIIFIAIVMVANKGRFLRFGQRLMPLGQETLLDEITVATSQSFGGFIRGQFGIAGLYGVVVGIIAFVFGVPFVALTAVLTAALQSIPYFGQLVSWLPLFVTTLVFAPAAIAPVTICLVIGLLVIQNIISPRVLGSAVGLNPILVLAAVFVGAQIAGAMGAVFGVPVAAVGVTLFNTWLDQVRPPAQVDAPEGQDPVAAAAAAKPELAALADPTASATDILAASRAELAEGQDRVTQDKQAVDDAADAMEIADAEATTDPGAVSDPG
jgi:predicted PurR-regulated permease PerM